MNYYIETCTPSHQTRIRGILKALPQWFGISSAIDEYITESLHKQILCVYDQSVLIGFLTLKETSKQTIEIYVMGIKKEYHHQGIGKHCIYLVCKYAIKKNYKVVQVKTLSPKVKNTYYLRTYNFYKSVGFYDVETLPLWDEHNPCLLMIQVI